MAYDLTNVNFRTVTDKLGFMAECDQGYKDKVSKAADLIAENRKLSPIVLLSGPSGSGKTTTSMNIAEELQRRGIGTHYVAMDDYFKTVDQSSPRTESGELDLESPLCVDMELMREHFEKLEKGERIFVPKYEFSRRMRDSAFSKTIKLKDDEIVIFEGIHALNGMIADYFPEAFKLYISARSDVEYNGEVMFKRTWFRLMRRMVRDYKFRGSAPGETMSMWANVRRGEKLYISPYKENADLMFDSSLAFEYAVLKPYVVPLLEVIPKGKYPFVDEMLENYKLIPEMDDSVVAENSLSREFIGGSSYASH